MAFGWFDKEKGETFRQDDRGDIEASCLRGGDDDSSAGVQREILHALEKTQHQLQREFPG